MCGIDLQNTKQKLLKLQSKILNAAVATVKTSVYFNMSLLMFFLFLLLWCVPGLLNFFFLFLYWNHAEGIFLLCHGCVRQKKLPHLCGILGLHRVLEYRLGDQMFQVLFHPLHHHLLLSVLFLVISFTWGHSVGVRLNFLLFIRTQLNVIHNVFVTY